MKVWRDTLGLRTVRDTFKEDGSDYSSAEIQAEIEHRLHTEGDNVKVARGVWTTVNALLKEWKKIISTIPEYIRRAARGHPLEWRYSAQAQSMMSALGWTPGLGLGPSLSGRPTIVEAGTGNVKRKGLGLRPKRGTRI